MRPPPEQRIRPLETKLREHKQLSEKQLKDALDLNLLLRTMRPVVVEDPGISFKKVVPPTISRLAREKSLRIERSCRRCGVSRQGRYQRCQRQVRHAARDGAVRVPVRVARTQLPRLGTRKRHHRRRLPPARAGHRHPQRCR